MGINDRMFEAIGSDGSLPHGAGCSGDHSDGGDCIPIAVFDIPTDDPQKIMQMQIGRYLQIQFTMDISEDDSVQELAEIFHNFEEAEKHHIGPTIMSLFHSACASQEARHDLIEKLNNIFKWSNN